MIGVRLCFVAVLTVPVSVLPGPYGEKDDQQLFIQKVVPETSQLFVRLSSTGQRSVVSAICWCLYS